MPFRVSFHVGVEPLCAAHEITVGLAPNLVSVIEGLRSGDSTVSTLALFFKELQYQIVVLLILPHDLLHVMGHFQPKPLVLEVPGDQPREDTLHSFLRLELIFQVLVLFFLLEMAVELDHPHTVRSEQRLVVDRGEVIAGEPKSELREKSRGSLIEVPGFDFLTAGELLDRFLVQFAILIALSHRDKPLTFQGRKHGVGGFGVLASLRLADDRHGRHGRIVTEKVVNGTQHGRLSVAGGLAVKNEHTFLVCHAEHRVAEGFLQILGLVCVTTSDLRNELLPPFTPRVLQGVLEIGLHGEKVVPVMLPKFHLFEIIGAVETVNEIGVGVEFLSGNRHDTRSVLHKPVTETAISHLHDELHVLPAAVFVSDFSAIQGHQAAELLDLLSHQQRTNILSPSSLRVSEPAFRFGAIPSVILVALGKQLCHTGLVPRIAGAACLVTAFRLRFLDVKHLPGLVFVHDVATI